MDISWFNVIIVLGIYGFILFLIFNNDEWNLNVSLMMSLGAITILGVGSIFAFYTPFEAFDSIDFTVIFTIIGLEIVSLTLKELGFFSLVGQSINEHAQANPWILLILLLGVTFCLSLFLNNLITIIIIVKITIEIVQTININPIPFIAGEILVSNFAGASTQIGDFPNILIASTTSLPFWNFIIYMSPVTLLLFIFTLFFLKYKCKYIKNKNTDESRKYQKYKKDTIKWVGEYPILAKSLDLGTDSKDIDNQHVFDLKASFTILFILIQTCVCIFILPLKFGTPLAFVAAFSGVFSLFVYQVYLRINKKTQKNPSNIKIGKILNELNVENLTFFVSLFIMVGAIRSTGILELSAQLIISSTTNICIICLLVLSFSSLITSFIGAGPSTAIFIPIILGLNAEISHNAIWWSLSLGVCAGSSATIVGATGGPISMNIVGKAVNNPNPIDSAVESFGIKNKWRRRLDIIRYSVDYGLPIAFTFWIISALYIISLLSIGDSTIIFLWGIIVILFLFNIVKYFYSTYKKHKKSIAFRVT